MAAGQTASLCGQVFDESGAVIPNATITITGSSGVLKTTTTTADGWYCFSGLRHGFYTVQAIAPKLEQEPVKLNLKTGSQTLPLKLRVASTKQQTTVQENAGPTLSTESSANVSALVLKGEDLKMLADDPEDLMTDLQALAGPSAGPSGGSVFIDGFSTGQLPSKDSIREVRINQNPFSPEYDRLGYGRIEILTKPGADKFHGTGYYNFGDSVWNSRNPYAAEKAPFLLKEYGASFDGPLSKLASFFFTIDRAAIDNGAVINGTTLNPNTLAIIDPYTHVFSIPQRRIRISPRVDYQLTPSDTLSLRYAFSTADIEHSGVGGFNLVSTGIHHHGNDHTVQIANTKILGLTAINETRFQFYRATVSSTSDHFTPQIDVLNSFIGGGAQVGHSLNLLNTYEFQNNTTVTHGVHTVRFGVRVRGANIGNSSPVNFGGTFTFAGTLAPELNANNEAVLNPFGAPMLVSIDSIESYRRTLLFTRMGLSPLQIRALGGGASQFTIGAGRPSLSINEEDVGIFVNDDWRAMTNLTINAGLRYEGQTTIHDWRDFGPRIGLAWAPAKRKANVSPRTIIRAGFGIFYQRFDITDALLAERYNGIVQQQYVITNPGFFPAIPSVASLSHFRPQQATEQLSPNLRAPHVINSAIAFERQIKVRTAVALTYLNAHGLHQFLTNDINASLPGTYNPQVPGSGIRPLGSVNPLFNIESSGLYNQNELIANFNSTLTGSVSLFGSYVYNRALSNTDYVPPPLNTNFNPAISSGSIGIGTFSANPYSREGEYGPASTDIHHQVTFGGSVATKCGLSFNPLFITDSGAPFNITVGHDLYGDTLFNGRPSLASDSNRPGTIPTAYGLLDPNPMLGEPILPRNFGRGPAIIMLNLRVSKIFAFGPRAEQSVSTGGRRPQTGPFGVGGSQTNTPSTRHRYNVVVSLSMRNILNHNNPGPIIGNIESPLFGRANQPYGAGMLGGTGFSESANNRRLELQARFKF
ncbi:MAG: carboxypeptidase regulatory-like domain-containing protein [Bryobacteraceae bacterium]